MQEKKQKQLKKIEALKKDIQEKEELLMMKKYDEEIAELEKRRATLAQEGGEENKEEEVEREMQVLAQLRADNYDEWIVEIERFCGEGATTPKTKNAKKIPVRTAMNLERKAAMAKLNLDDELLEQAGLCLNLLLNCQDRAEFLWLISEFLPHNGLVLS
jgi:hypothetical protein